MQGNILMFIVVNKGKGSKVLEYVKELGVRGATAFLARETIPNQLLKLFEIADVRKEIIMIAMPAKYESELIEDLIAKFHFDQPNHGVIFTVNLSSVIASSHFKEEDNNVNLTVEHSFIQAVMLIADKGNAEEIQDYIENQGFPRGIVIDAHGSADKSNKIFDLMFESEKEIILMITTRRKAHKLSNILNEHFNLNYPNSGILAILNLSHLIGINLLLENDLVKHDCDILEKPGHTAIFVVVEKHNEEAVIKSAESAGSTGGTIIRARGSSSYYGKNFFTSGVEEERELVMIIAKNELIENLCNQISLDLHLEEPGKGIIFTVPLYNTMGLAED